MLPKQGKLIALDLGTRRTGVAVSDFGQKIAFARPECEHQTEKELLKFLSELLLQEKAVGILMGRPTKLSGDETEQTLKVEELAAKIAKLGVETQFIDERLSTQIAENLQGFTTKEKHHDSRAAQFLLEMYLDSLS